MGIHEIWRTVMPLWIGRTRDGVFEIGSSSIPWDAENGFTYGVNYLGGFGGKNAQEITSQAWPLPCGTLVEIPDSLIPVCPTCGHALKGGG